LLINEYAPACRQQEIKENGVPAMQPAEGEAPEEAAAPAPTPAKAAGKGAKNGRLEALKLDEENFPSIGGAAPAPAAAASAAEEEEEEEQAPEAADTEPEAAAEAKPEAAAEAKPEAAAEAEEVWPTLPLLCPAAWLVLPCWSARCCGCAR
jgi:hypothetical protein